MPTRKNFPGNKKRRQVEAAARKLESDKLTPAQKLEHAVGAREKLKYAKILAKQAEKKA